MMKSVSPPDIRTPGSGGHRSQRAHSWLLALLAGAVHWSTAVAEMASAAIILRFAFAELTPLVRPVTVARSLLSRRFLPVLVLWGVYVLSVGISLSLAGELFTTHAGSLWRPFLFPVMLLTPLAVRDLRGVGSIYLLGGVAAGIALLLLNVAAGYQTPAIVFTGLTTVADQTALLAIITVALLGAEQERPRHLIGIVAAGIVLMMLLFWMAERAPVALLAVAGGVVVTFSRPRLLLPWGILTISLFFLAPAGLRARTDWVVHGNPIDRYIVWEEGARQLSAVPVFGAGPSSYALLLPADARSRFSHRPPGSWHNDFLQITLDSGPVAATAWGGLVLLGGVAACRTAWQLRRTGRSLHRAIPGLLFICLASLGLVGSVVTTAVLGSVYWSLMGLTVQEWITTRPGDHLHAGENSHPQYKEDL